MRDLVFYLLSVQTSPHKWHQQARWWPFLLFCSKLWGEYGCSPAASARGRPHRGQPTCFQPQKRPKQGANEQRPSPPTPMLQLLSSRSSHCWAPRELPSIESDPPCGPLRCPLTGTGAARLEGFSRLLTESPINVAPFRQPVVQQRHAILPSLIMCSFPPPFAFESRLCRNVFTCQAPESLSSARLERWAKRDPKRKIVIPGPSPRPLATKAKRVG